MTGYYVSATERDRAVLLLGPYPTLGDADVNVPRVTREVQQMAPLLLGAWTVGTTMINNGDLPDGALNESIHLHPCRMCVVRVGPHVCDYSGRVRVGADYTNQRT